MRPYSPGGSLNALAPALRGSIPPTPSEHRLRRGLPGYLILFATHALASQRQYRARKSPSPPVFLLISTNFTSTQEFHFPLPYSSLTVSNALPGLSPGLSHLTHQAAYTLLRPIIPNNACTPRITAAAGTELAGASFDGTVRHRSYLPLCGSFHPTELYDPKTFLTHAALLRQGLPHCARFLTAASRRSLDRVSVPVWLIILSDQLTIVALVGHYPTN